MSSGPNVARPATRAQIETITREHPDPALLKPYIPAAVSAGRGGRPPTPSLGKADLHAGGARLLDKTMGARNSPRARARARWPRDPSPGRCLWRPPLPLLRSGGTLGAPIRRVRCLRTRSARVETPEPRLRRISPQFSPGPLSGDAALEPGPAPTTLLRARSSARRSPSFLLPGKSFLSPSFVFGHRRDHDSVRLWRRSRANPFLWARACALVTPLAQLGQSDPRAASALVSVPPLDSINNNVLNHYT